MRVIFLIIFGFSLVQCTRVSNDLEKTSLYCGEDAISRPKNRLLVPQFENESVATSAKFSKAVGQNQDNDWTNLPITSKGCVEVPLDITTVYIQVSKEDRKFGSIVSAESLKTFPIKDAPIAVTLQEVFTQSPSISCGQEMKFANQTFDLPLENSEGMASSFLWTQIVRVHADLQQTLVMERKLRSSETFVNFIDTPARPQGIFNLEIRTLSFDQLIEGVKEPTLRGLCSLAVIHESASLQSFQDGKVQITAPGDSLPIQTNQSLIQPFMCREEVSLDEFSNEGCKARSTCMSKANYIPTNQIVTEKSGLYRYFYFLKNPVELDSAVACMQVAVVDKTETKIKSQWLGSVKETLKKPQALISADISVFDAIIPQSILYQSLECKVELLKDTATLIYNEEVACRSGRCQDKSLMEWTPCSKQIDIDISSLFNEWRGMDQRLALKTRIQTLPGRYIEQTLGLLLARSAYLTESVFPIDLDRNEWEVQDAQIISDRALLFIVSAKGNSTEERLTRTYRRQAGQWNLITEEKLKFDSMEIIPLQNGTYRKIRSMDDTYTIDILSQSIWRDALGRSRVECDDLRPSAAGAWLCAIDSQIEVFHPTYAQLIDLSKVKCEYVSSDMDSKGMLWVACNDKIVRIPKDEDPQQITVIDNTKIEYPHIMVDSKNHLFLVLFNDEGSVVYLNQGPNWERLPTPASLHNLMFDREPLKRDIYHRVFTGAEFWSFEDRSWQSNLPGISNEKQNVGAHTVTGLGQSFLVKSDVIYQGATGAGSYIWPYQQIFAGSGENLYRRSYPLTSDEGAFCLKIRLENDAIDVNCVKTMPLVAWEDGNLWSGSHDAIVDARSVGQHLYAYDGISGLFLLEKGRWKKLLSAPEPLSLFAHKERKTAFSSAGDFAFAGESAVFLTKSGNSWLRLSYSQISPDFLLESLRWNKDGTALYVRDEKQRLFRINSQGVVNSVSQEEKNSLMGPMAGFLHGGMPGTDENLFDPELLSFFADNLELVDRDRVAWKGEAECSLFNTRTQRFEFKDSLSDRADLCRFTPVAEGRFKGILGPKLIYISDGVVTSTVTIPSFKTPGSGADWLFVDGKRIWRIDLE